MCYILCLWERNHIPKFTLYTVSPRCHVKCNHDGDLTEQGLLLFCSTSRDDVIQLLYGNTFWCTKHHSLQTKDLLS